MLSTLLIVAFLSRQAWGLFADRYGGLVTTLVCSAFQAVAIWGYLYVNEEYGLFAVSIAYGLGFSGLMPAYVLTVREAFPASQAHWRVPAFLMMSSAGMSVGGWLAGYLYDTYASYDQAFISGVAANVLNLVLLGTLLWYGRKMLRPGVS
jgi:MFS family permease